MSKFPRKLVSNTEPLASTAGMYTTIERLQSFTAATGGMAITAVAITDNTYTALDDTAVNTSGGYIKLTGTGFASGAVAYINSIAATTTFTSSTELRVVVPANVVGTYSLTAFNTTGAGAIWAAGIAYSGFPTVTTSSYTNSSAVVSTQLVATGDGTLVYSLQGGSTLPSGVNLSSSGLLSGTVTGITVSTVYTFTVLVNDAQLQTTQQLITLSVVLNDAYFNSTVLLLHGDGPAIPATIEILVVAGGGGGRDVSGAIAGIRDSAGGGAGGVIYNAALAITSGAVYPLTIGTGGASATAGISSVWNTSFTASGGGAGGQVYIAGGAGGSGGGGANYQSAAGASNQSAYSGWTVYGNAGGAGIDTGPAWGAGGGGGAGAAGAAGTSTTGGAGGVGISNSITGVATYYAGGGGGGAANGAIAAGGAGGGGASTNSAIGGAGTPNTGGGGGGVGNTTGVSYAGGAGGSGVSVIAYPSAYADLVVSSGLTYTMSTVTRSGYKVYTFTAGTGTITIPSNDNNTFKDSSTNNFTITRTGTPTQGTFTPFSQTGWSGYFNGSSNIANTTSTAFTFGTADFTVEYWVNYAVINNTYNALCGNGTGASGFGFGLANGAGQLYITTSTNGYPSTGTGLVVNQWYHVAFVRISGTVKFYLNGVLNYTGSIPTNITETAFAIGQKIGGTFPSTVHVSNLRVVKGTGIYTAAFTPPTAPLTAITNTSLLTLQSNNFKDNSSNNFAITATGTPSIQAFSPFAPAAAYSTATVGGSGYFNGSTDYLTAPNNSQFTLGSDFTIEGWIYPLALSGYVTVINKLATDVWGPFNIQFSGTTLQVYSSSNGTTWNIVFGLGSIAVSLNTWTHFAFTRYGNVYTLWVGGVSSFSVTVAATPYVNTSAVGIGSFSGSAYRNFNGYISNARIVNGTAVYTAAFTPPTAPLTAVTNTSLLLNATNAAIFDATAKNDVTTVGTAQASTTQSKFGGTSMYFNGTTNYLTTPYNINTQFKASNFTIEYWVYFNTVAGNQRICGGDNPTASALYNWAMYINTSGTLAYYLSSNGTAWDLAIQVTVGTIAAGQWYHIALVRNGTNVTPYLNGVAGTVTAVSTTALYTNTFGPTIGTQGTSYFSGYIDDFRITKYARYTANFTPPTSTFLDQ